jgi:hypothetical protein
MSNVVFTPTVSGVGNWVIDISISTPGATAKSLHFSQASPNAQTIALPPGIYPLQINGGAPQAAPGAPAGTKTLNLTVDGDVMVDKSHDYLPGTFLGDQMTIDAI